jgi:hypothetical protein
MQPDANLASIVALGAWVVALGAIASDIVQPSDISDQIFRCGNFGMLVICAMDR